MLRPSKLLATVQVSFVVVACFLCQNRYSLCHPCILSRDDSEDVTRRSVSSTSQSTHQTTYMICSGLQRPGFEHSDYLHIHVYVSKYIHSLAYVHTALAHTRCTYHAVHTAHGVQGYETAGHGTHLMTVSCRLVSSCHPRLPQARGSCSPDAVLDAPRPRRLARAVSFRVHARRRRPGCSPSPRPLPLTCASVFVPVHRGVRIFLVNDIYGAKEREETRLWTTRKSLIPCRDWAGRLTGAMAAGS